MSAPRRKKETGWLKIKVLAAVFDVTDQGFRTSYMPLVPPHALRKNGRAYEIHARTLLEAWSDARAAPRRAADDAGGAVGDLTPAEWKAKKEQHQAELAEQKVLERRDVFVKRVQVQGVLSRIAGAIRRATARAERELEPKTPESSRPKVIWDDTLEEIRREARGYLGDETEAAPE